MINIVFSCFKEIKIIKKGVKDEVEIIKYKI